MAATLAKVSCSRERLERRIAPAPAELDDRAPAIHEQRMHCTLQPYRVDVRFEKPVSEVYRAPRRGRREAEGEPVARADRIAHAEAVFGRDVVGPARIAFEAQEHRAHEIVLVHALE